MIMKFKNVKMTHAMEFQQQLQNSYNLYIFEKCLKSKIQNSPPSPLSPIAYRPQWTHIANI